MSPENAVQLAEFMAAKNNRGEQISGVDLHRMSRVLELTPEDMTVTVEAGIPLADLQQALAGHAQWLPIDPSKPQRTTIHEILSRDLSGPRRFGYGTIREHLIGMKVVLADGRLIKSGGKVVKNVAGYDLAKLFIGARDSLGIIVEATFKVRPMPQVERIVHQECDRSGADAVLREVRESEMMPGIVDMHRTSKSATYCVVLGLAGTKAEVDWQLGIASRLGFTQESSLDYDSEFWSDSGLVRRVSVLPSRVVERAVELEQSPFIARAGNGVIYFRGEKPRESDNMPISLMRRVKCTFDPKNILPEFTL